MSLLACLGLALSIGYAVPSDAQLRPAPTAQANLVCSRAHVFASAARPDLYKLGQTMGPLETIGFGVGYSFPVTESWSLTIDAGRYDVDVDPAPAVEREAVLRSLINNHGEPGFSPTEFTYELDPAYGFGVSADYHSNNWLFSVGLHYRKHREFFNMWTGQRHDLDADEPDCGCWWQQYDHLDASYAQIKVTYQIGVRR
ncbi:MAG: hypothetical protein AAF529_08890 [Pseudomonadota bacterium]